MTARWCWWTTGLSWVDLVKSTANVMAGCYCPNQNCSDGTALMEKIITTCLETGTGTIWDDF
jgi:hypothetical protein